MHVVYKLVVDNKSQNYTTTLFGPQWKNNQDFTSCQPNKQFKQDILSTYITLVK